jgi:hypothetical protein
MVIVRMLKLMHYNKQKHFSGMIRSKGMLEMTEEQQWPT